MTHFSAWVDDGAATGTIVIDEARFTVTPDLAYGVVALLMEIDRLNSQLAEALGADVPTGPGTAVAETPRFLDREPLPPKLDGNAPVNDAAERSLALRLRVAGEAT